MVAPYSVRIHPYSRLPAPGGRYYLLRVFGTTEYLFSLTPAGAPGAPVLFGSAPDMLGLKIEGEGACLVHGLNGDVEAIIKPLSNEETAALRAEMKASQGEGR